MQLVRQPSVPVNLRHGTTVIALRFADGVVMAGDRRATEGNFIAHRAMEKVFPADRHSAVAIAGAAGPAIEMVRLFQTQLEHYEKVEGVALSFEGKANQLGQMVREHLPMAMQGLVVVPLFAGLRHRQVTGQDLHLRRHRRPLRRGGLRGDRFRRTRRALDHQDELARRHGPRRRRRARGAGSLRGRRRGFGDRRARPGPWHLSSGGNGDPAAGYEQVPEGEVAERFAATIERLRGANRP